MNKRIEKHMNQLNKRLKADNSPVRYTAVQQYSNCWWLKRCNVQYNDKGKERLVNSEVIFQYIATEEITRMLMAMVLAIDAII